MKWKILFWALLIAPVIAVSAYVYYGHVTLRVAVGPQNGLGQKFLAAFIPIFNAERPRIYLASVPGDDLTATAMAMDTGAADLAIVRPDIMLPDQSRTVAILRRDPCVFLAFDPNVRNISDLKGKTIGVFEGRIQNEDVLASVLAFNKLSSDSVRSVVLKSSDAAAAVRDKNVDAIFVIGPVGPGLISDLVATITNIGVTPKLLPISELDAFTKLNPMLESGEIERGAFQANPALPAEQTAMLTVTYRLVARSTMLDWIAGEITRLLFENKLKLATVLPSAYFIEPPDTSARNVLLPTHPGTTKYFRGEESSSSLFEGMFYFGWALLTVAGVAYARLRSQLSKRYDREVDADIARLLEIMRDSKPESKAHLDAYDSELDKLTESILKLSAQKSINRERLNDAFSMILQARQAIVGRRVQSLSQ